MKSIFILLLAAAAVAAGGAFFGLFTIPGLENFPTVDSLGKERHEAIRTEAQERFEGRSPGPTGGGRRTQGFGARGGALRGAEGAFE